MLNFVAIIMIFYCSKVYDKAEDQSKTTWYMQLLILINEYEGKPWLAPPLIIVSLIWKTVRHFYKHRRDMKSS